MSGLDGSTSRFVLYALAGVGALISVAGVYFLLPRNNSDIMSDISGELASLGPIKVVKENNVELIHFN